MERPAESEELETAFRRPPFRPGSAAAGTRARVVIVGSGFGGLVCARKLDRTAVDVLLVDRRGYHLFSPLLYQVATALLNPSDIAYPLRRVFRKSYNVRVQQGTVSGVDFQRKVVHVCAGTDIPYDYLVLATGSTDSHFGNEKVAQVSIGLKTLEDAARLRNHVLACLEHADLGGDPDERRALLTFVVAGGGPTGVEYAGALGELTHLVAGRDYPRVARDEIRIVLVEGKDRLLSTFSERLGRYAERVLTKRGVEVRTGTLVETADERSVTLSDGHVLPAHTVVWTGGVQPEMPGTDPPVPRTRSRRVEVDAYLRIRDAEGAYAIGDVAGAAQDGTELPMLSAPAMQAGRYVARSILTDLMGGRPDQPFHYFDKGTMATIGRNAGIAHLRGGLELTGVLGWLAWIFVHIWYLIGFRNRVITLISWAWNYFRFDRPIRIILQTRSDPIASTLTAPDPDRP
jgi:NADH dehydrogenase